MESAMNSSWNSTLVNDENGSSSSDVVSLMRKVLAAVGSLGVISNSLALVVLLTYVDFRKRKAVLYIINQTVADLLTGFFLFVTKVRPSNNAGLGTSLGDQLYCHLWVAQIPMWGSFTVSTTNLVVLTLERYFSIVFPIKHKLMCTKTKIVASIPIMWVLAFTYQLAMTSPGVKIIAGYCSLFSWDSPQTQQAKGIFGSFVDYFIPLVLLIFCYGRMFRALQTRIAPSPAVQAPSSTAAPSSHMQDRAKRNLVKMMTIVATAFVLCTSWNQWWYLLYNLKLLAQDSYTTSYYQFSVIALFTNCFVNPFIYVARYEEFQNGVKKIYRKISGKLSAQKQ